MSPNSCIDPIVHTLALSHLAKHVTHLGLTSLARALAKEKPTTPVHARAHDARTRQSVHDHALDAPVPELASSRLTTSRPLLSPTGPP
jgi:hypothetical protein